MDEQQREALKSTTVHLIAAISLLRKLHEDLPRSKKHGLFNAKIADYEKAVEKGRIALGISPERKDVPTSRDEDASVP